MERWIGPYRSIGERWLPSAEVLHLRRSARKYIALGRTIFVTGCVFMLTWALISLYALVYHQDFWYTQPLTVVTWIIGGVVSFSSLAWIGYRLIKIGQENRCESIVGVYERFVLRIDAASIRQTFGPDLEALLEIPEAEGESEAEWYIDVFPISERIRTINGTVCSRYKKVTIRDVAPIKRINEKGFPAHLAADTKLGFQPRCARHLSTMERKELRSIVFRYLRRRVLPWTLAGLAFGAFTWLGLSWMPDIIDTLAYVLLIFTWTCFTTVVYRSYQLVRDLSSSMVVEMKDKEATTEDGDPLEVLPHTQWVWTRGGQPASWRKS